jgi:hypothetical protein
LHEENGGLYTAHIAVSGHVQIAQVPFPQRVPLITYRSRHLAVMNETTHEDLEEMRKFASAMTDLNPRQLLSDVADFGFTSAADVREAKSDDEPPKNAVSSDLIPIQGYLGQYDHESQRITIYNKGLESASETLDCTTGQLRFIVRLHEWAHALVHVGLYEDELPRAARSRRGSQAESHE